MRAVALVLLLLVAGCVAPAAVDAPAQPAPVTPAFPQEHDHTDPALHAHADGLRAVGSHTLAPDGGARGDWATSEIIIRGDHAYVAYIGAPWIVGIVDVRDPAAPVLVGQAPLANAWGMDVAVSDDGDWVYAAVYPATAGELFSPGYGLSHLALPDGPAAPGIVVIDARDRTAPTVASFFPVQGLGPHTVWYHQMDDGRELVFANKADLRGGNSVVITEAVTTPTGGRALRPVSVWWYDGPADVVQPHDVDVQTHPITGATLLYVAYEWEGMVIVDISDPSQPRMVSRIGEGSTEWGADLIVHDVHPYPALVAGRHFTLAAPEIITGDTTGTLRIYDTTDPAGPWLVGTWRMPGDLIVDEPFGFSMHNFVYLPDGRAAIAHGHAGVWIVDWLTSMGEAPVGTAYYAKAFEGSTQPPWAPVHGDPWFWGTAVGPDGTLWASDTMGGIVSLAEASMTNAGRTKMG